MATEEDSQLGTAALRRTVETIRAQAGAAPPEPAADPFAAPWLSQPPPPNGRHRTAVDPSSRPAPEPRKITPATIDETPGKRVTLKGTPTRKLDKAWKLAHRLLQSYGSDLQGNVAKADLHLARNLMDNGVLLMRYGIPMEQLGGLIRLARDLAHHAGSEGQEDPQIDELRRSLERPESDLPAVIQGPDDEPEGDDNGE